MLVTLLKLVAVEPLYFNLRTTEQLAYSVSFDTYKSLNILGYKIGVASQETKFMAEYIDERIENFRRILMTTIEHMSDDDFNAIKATLRRNKLNELNDVSEEAQRNWNEINTNQYEFDRHYKEVECLSTITKHQLLEFYRTHYGQNERKLSVQIIGNGRGNETNKTNETDEETQQNISSDALSYVGFNGEPKGHLIDDFMAFKNSLDVYPAEN